MKITISLPEFQEAIKKAQKLLPKKPSVEILRHLHLITSDNTIIATATDLETILKFNLQGRIEESGQLIIPQETLKIIAKIKKGYDLTITNSTIKVDNKVINYGKLPVEEYPPTNTYNFNHHGFSTTQKELFNLLAVKYAASYEEARPMFCTVCIDKEYFIATDTHRMAVKKFEFENNLEFKTLVPIQAINLLDSLINKKSDNKVECHVAREVVKVVKSERVEYKHIQFTFDNVTMITRVVEGNFPDWQQVIPQKFQTNITVDKDVIMEELDFAKELLKKNESNVVRLSAKEDSLFIKAISVSNTVESNIPANISDNDLELIGLNYNYLIDAIKNVSEKEIKLSFAGKLAPVLINNNDLVLPVRIA